MIIRYSVSNFLSFNEEVEISMIPGRARKHQNHIVKDETWNGINILRSAVIYGANAAGKSNLVKSLGFMRNLVLHGTKPRRNIEYQCFKFEKACRSKPTRFEIEIRVNNQNFAYGFELAFGQVLSEWLYSITKSSNKMVFERKTIDDETIVEFGRVETTNEEEKQFLNFTGKGTRSNQLFLTESIERGVKQFEEIYDWFDNSLTLIFPESKFSGFEVEIETDEILRKSIEDFLHLFNTGISGISYKDIDYENEFEIPKAIRDDIEKDVSSGSKIVFRSPDERRYLVRNSSRGEIQVSELVADHKMIDSDEIAHLEITFESDGTQRLLDLIPGLLSMAGSNRVFVIDELDRSLHPALSYKILQLFLIGKHRSQLIVTTHETGLLDLELLRRDEIWFVEKDNRGASILYSLEEFTPRYDKDIRKGYLLGRFGAIPIMGDVSDLGWVRN